MWFSTEGGCLHVVQFQRFSPANSQIVFNFALRLFVWVFLCFRIFLADEKFYLLKITFHFITPASHSHLCLRDIKKQFKNIFFHLPSYWLNFFHLFASLPVFYNFIKCFSSSPLSIKLRTNRISLCNTEKWWDESSAVGERWLGCVLFHILFNCAGKKGADPNTLVHTSFSLAAAVLFTLLLTRNWIKNSSSRSRVISQGGRWVWMQIVNHFLMATQFPANIRHYSIHCTASLLILSERFDSRKIPAVLCSQSQ